MPKKPGSYSVSIDEFLDNVTHEEWVRLPPESQAMYSEYIDLRQGGQSEGEAVIAMRERAAEKQKLLARSKESGRERRIRRAKENLDNESAYRADLKAQQEGERQTQAIAQREAKQSAAKRLLTASKEAPMGESYEIVGYTDPAGLSGAALPVQTMAPAGVEPSELNIDLGELVEEEEEGGNITVGPIGHSGTGKGQWGKRG